MSSAFLGLLSNYAATQITHIGLTNSAGTELSSFYYTRKPVTWDTSVAGYIRPSADIDFIVVPGDSIKNWVGFNAASGGTALITTPVVLFEPVSLYIYRLQSISTGLLLDILGD
jgi:hypothetical protein